MHINLDDVKFTMQLKKLNHMQTNTRHFKKGWWYGGGGDDVVIKNGYK